MAPTVPESIRSFLDEEVKEHQFLGFFGLTKSTTTIAKGEYLRIDLQCMTTERPGEPRAYNLQMQVNNEAKGALAKLDRTSETSTLRRSRPTLATILVDAEVDPEKISESSMKSFWIEVTEPWTKKSKNKGRVDKDGQFTKEKEDWEEDGGEDEQQEAESSKAGGAKGKKGKKAGKR